MAFAHNGNLGSASRKSPTISHLFLTAIETSVHADADGSRAAKIGGWFLRFAALAVLALLIPRISFATGLSFQGVVSALSTGSVTLSLPADMTVDTAGNVYIADTGDNQIVKVTPQGAASVFAISGLGTALNSPTGVAIDGSGNLYIADSGNNRVVEVTPAGSGSVVDTSAVTMNSPRGVALDPSGDIFIADTGNNRIVEVPAGGAAAVFSITGLGTALSAPTGVAVDASGNLYIADSANNRIVTVTAGGTAGSVLTINGLGTALSNPTGVAVDSVGNVYIADTSNSRAVTVDASGNGSVVNTGSVTLGQPKGIAVDISGILYIADTSHSRAVAVAMSAVGFGHAQMGTSSAITLTLPFSIGSTTLGAVKAFTFGAQSLDFTVASGNTCTSGISDTSCSVNIQYLPTAPGLRRGAVVLYDTATPPNPMLTVPLYAFSDSPLAAMSPNVATVVNTGGVTTSFPFQLAIDGVGNIYSGNYEGANVVEVPAGGGSASVVNTGGETLQYPTGVALDGAGNLFIADNVANQIFVVTPGGAGSALSINGLSTPINGPTELAFDAAGNLYIADWLNGRIVKVSSLAVAGSTSAGNGTVISTGSYSFPGGTLTGVAVDLAGTIYIADRSNNRVVQVTASGVASLLAPSGITFNNPQGVGVDGMGNIYVADSGDNQIVQITTAGVASVVQVPGLTNPSALSDPFGVSVDASGDVFIPDSVNNRIVKVDVTGGNLSFPTTTVGSTSSAETVTVTNLGNESLVLAAAPTYTPNFSENGGDTSLCALNTSVAPGTTCDVSVEFTPQSAGSLAANIVVTDNQRNASNSTQQIAVSGTGVIVPITPTIDWTQPSPITYGTNLSGVLNASAMNGSATVAGSFTYTATPQGGSANAVTAATVLGVGSYTLTAAFTPTDTTHYNSASGSVTLTVGKATPAILLSSSATSVPLNTAVTFTARLSFSTGTPTGSVSFYDGSTLQGTGTLAQGVATYTAASLTVGTHLITAAYGGDGSFLAVTSAVLTESVGRTASSVTLTSSASSVIVTTAVTFKATVAASTGTPSGSVSFYDGTTLLGSEALAQDTATYTTSTLATGTHSITAVYGGDSTFAPATSTALTEIVEDFTLVVSSGMSMVSPGETASYGLKVNPAGGSTLPAAVTLTVSGVPTGAVSTITPATVAAGTGPASVALAVQVPSQTASLGRSELLAFKLSPMMVGMLLLPFGGRIRRAAGKHGRAAALLLFAVVVIPLAGLAGCASHNTSSLATQQQSYTLTVTATSGTVSHSVTLKLIVQ
jgi:sugar lactone lactonase YvrE